jgi:ribosomal protein L37AE/L43A
VTLVVDIACPSCDRTQTLRKVAIGTYRCGDCGREFSREEIDPSL